MVDQTTIEVVLEGEAEAAAFCERVCLLLEQTGADVVVCDVGALIEPDCGMVDTLARLQLSVHRLGRRMGLRHASPELLELLELAGLSDVIHDASLHRL